MACAAGKLTHGCHWEGGGGLEPPTHPPRASMGWLESDAFQSTLDEPEESLGHASIIILAKRQIL